MVFPEVCSPLLLPLHKLVKPRLMFLKQLILNSESIIPYGTQSIQIGIIVTILPLFCCCFVIFLKLLKKQKGSKRQRSCSLFKNINMDEIKRKALFVCLGNSCRSPIAEGVFQKTVNKMAQGHLWEIDSAGLADWNVGYSPTNRAQNTMKRHDVPYNNVGRQITQDDFNNYDFIFGMDESNMKDLREMAPEGCKAKIFLFGEFDPDGERIIRDPYFDNHDRGFEKCYQQVVRCSKGFLEWLEQRNDIM